MSPGNRRHIVMVTADYMPDVFGGAEQQCRKLSAELVRRGHEVTVLTGTVHRDLPAIEVDQGIVVHRLHGRHSPQAGGAHILSSLRYIGWVMRWIARRRATIDVVHAHQAKVGAVAAVAAARRTGLPSVVKVGSAGERKFDFFALERKMPLAGARAAAFVRDRADRIVAISRDLVVQLGDYGVPPQRIVHIPNGVDLPDLDLARGGGPGIRTALGFGPDDVVAVFTGRLAFDKNLEVLLEATALALAAVPQFRLVVVGGGEARADLEARAASLGILDRVRFTGRLDTVEAHLAAADVFVLPARAEGMSNALLEAMSMACPAIASRVSGNVDLVVDDETGWLFDPSEVRALADLMVRAARLPRGELREMGARGRRLVEARHDIPRIAERYLDLYRELVPSHRERGS